MNLRRKRKIYSPKVGKAASCAPSVGVDRSYPRASRSEKSKTISPEGLRLTSPWHTSLASLRHNHYHCQKCRKKCSPRTHEKYIQRTVNRSVFRDFFTSTCEKLCVKCSPDALDQIDEGNTDRPRQSAPLISIQIFQTSDPRTDIVCVKFVDWSFRPF